MACDPALISLATLKMMKWWVRFEAVLRVQDIVFLNSQFFTEKVLTSFVGCWLVPLLCQSLVGISSLEVNRVYIQITDAILPSLLLTTCTGPLPVLPWFTSERWQEASLVPQDMAPVSAIPPIPAGDLGLSSKDDILNVMHSPALAKHLHIAGCWETTK